MRHARVAEIWAIKSVVSHHALRSCDCLNDLLVKMIPSSNVATEFWMEELNFVTLCYGLAPYFKSKIMKSLSCSSCIKPNFVVYLMKHLTQ